MLAVGDLNGNVYVWHVGTSQPPVSLPGQQGNAVCAVAFDPRGNIVAAATMNSSAHQYGIVIWQVNSRKLLHTFHDPGSAVVTSLAFNPGDASGNAYLWNMSWLGSSA